MAYTSTPRVVTLLRDRLSDELGRLETPAVAVCVEAFHAFAGSVRLVDDAYLPRLLHQGRVVFEGAQGVLLDEWHGFHPYTTWSTNTFANAEALLAEAGLAGGATRLGVLRTYATRHGPGPFVTEDPGLTASLPDRHNTLGRWQGAFRVGPFDAVGIRYAVEVCGGADALALTHLDVTQARADLRICRAYDIGGLRVERLPVGTPGNLDRQERLTRRLLTARPLYGQVAGGWIETIGDVLDIPVVLGSYGPTAAAKRELRSQAGRGAAA